MSKLSIPPLNAFSSIMACAVVAALLSGCYASQGRWAGYTRVHDVRADYSALWSAREAEHIKKVSTLKDSASASVSQAVEQNSYVAVIDTLRRFKELRQSGTVLSGAFSWVKNEFDRHVDVLKEIGASPKDIQLFETGRFEAMADTLGTEKAISVAYHYSSMKELRTLATQLSSYRQKYVSAFRQDKAEEPPDHPPNTMDINVIMNAVQAGVRAAHGR